MNLDPAESSPDPAVALSRAHRLGWIGIAMGVGAAISYTLANTCLRDVSTKLDYVLCASAKATCTAAIVWPWALWAARRGTPLLPPRKQMIWMVLAAIQVQFLGGVMLQIALGTIGMALVVPIYLGAMVFGTASLARWLLREPVDHVTLISLGLLVTAVAVLSLGAKQAHAGMAAESAAVLGGLSFVAGALAAVVVGLSYAVLAVTIRGVFQTCDVVRQAPVVIVATVGMVMLGSWSLCRGGWTDLTGAPRETVWMLVGGGTFNACGFLCLAAAISLLPVIYVNAINMSQAAMAAVVGVALFGEAPSAFLVIGLLVMMAGFGLLSAAKLHGAGKASRSLQEYEPPDQERG